LGFSPDGRTVVTGSADATVRFWDATNGDEYGMLKGHKVAAGFDGLTVALSPDGRHLVTGSADRAVKAWKTTSFKNGERIRPVAAANQSVKTEWFSRFDLTLARLTSNQDLHYSATR
jgi:WD40 repeat protein